MSRSLVLSNSELIEKSVANNEGELTHTGALLSLTGNRTGRSPNDRFIVKENSTEDKIDWGDVNKPFNAHHFDKLWNKVNNYLDDKVNYVSNVHVGANKDHYIPVEVKSELAWHSLFSKLIFISPHHFNEENKEVWKIVTAADYVCDPKEDHTNSESCVIINFLRRRVLIAGMKYAGEMKKSMFAVQNFLLPEKGVLPMHCSANQTSDGRTTLFFGLSGTGKTTLSADPKCSLIGDDEHGWGDGTVFNFEGGCYAKVIKLSAEQEPEIFQTTRTFGTILENVVLDESARTIDLDDGSLTENTRASYPISQIPNASMTGRGGQPKNIVFLTCDAFGVLPPVAKLSPAQAMYHFINGYTAKVAGTEKGVTEPSPTFSPCFGGPFLPLHPRQYAELLGKNIETHAVKVWFINTGWTGGAYGTGERMAINHTRAIVNAVRDGELELGSRPSPHIDRR